MPKAQPVEIEITKGVIVEGVKCKVGDRVSCSPKSANLLKAMGRAKDPSAPAKKTASK